MKKTVLISVAIASLLLVGCGGGSDDSSTPAKNDGTSPTTNTQTDNSSNTSGTTLSKVAAQDVKGYKFSTITLSNGISASVEFKCDGSFETDITLNGNVIGGTIEGNDIEITTYGIEGKAIGVTKIIEFTGIDSDDNEESRSHITLNDDEYIVVGESNYGSSNMTIDKIEQVTTCN
ncbi:MAG TPA: hypothetical protein ENK88_04965 [Campylobacterales bacterium]|nr:hypothetical protein [Campylobacterales bacterium]